MGSIVVAISGFKGSGKDTAADHLVSNYSFTRISLADPLKEWASKEFNVPLAHFNEPSLKEQPILSMPVVTKDATARYICEYFFKEFVNCNGQHPDSFTYVNDNKFVGLFGTPGNFTTEQLYHCPRSLAILKGSTNRVVNENYWTNQVLNKISLKEFPSKHAVIPDLRYRSEIETLKHNLDKLITIRIDRFDTVNSNDPSEIDLANYDKFDYIVNNRTTISDFKINIDLLMKYLDIEKLKVED